MLPAYQLHLAKLEGPLDRRLCQNAGLNCMTAGDTAFGANQAAKLKQAQQMASSLNNLANATIQKNTTIKNLVATNAMLTKAVADIQLSITQMCATSVSTSPTPMAPAPMTEARVCPSHWSNTKPGWVLLDTRLQGQSWPHQHHTHVAQDQPSAWCNPGEHHGWQNQQCRIPSTATSST